MNGLDRHHLQLLAAIAAEGQLGAAARSLHLSPSAASHRIREAERRLDVTLLERHGRTVTLSAAGRLLATVAQSTERQLLRAEQASRWMRSPTETGRLRVGVGAFDTLAWLDQAFDPGTVARLNAHSVDVITVRSGSEQQALRAGEIDLALTASAEPNKRATHHHLADDRLVAVLPAGFPDFGDGPTGRRFEPHHARDVDFLSLSFEPIDGWELDRFLDPVESEPRSMRLVDRASLLLRMVAAGHGITIQPTRAVPTGLLESGAIVVAELSMRLPIHWYAVTTVDPGDKVRTLVDLLGMP